MQYRLECINPILSVQDMQKSRTFYVDMLGFEWAHWSTEEFACAIRNGQSLYFSRHSQGNPGTWIWLGFEGDIEGLHNSLVAKGVEIRQSPINFPWAKEMQVYDPDRHVLRFGTEPDPNEPFVDKKEADL